MFLSKLKNYQEHENIRNASPYDADAAQKYQNRNRIAWLLTAIKSYFYSKDEYGKALTASDDEIWEQYLKTKI